MSSGFVFYLTVISNALLFAVCVSAVNRMTRRTLHCIRLAVVLIAGGAAYSIAAAFAHGHDSWLLPIGALLLLVAERRGGIEQFKTVFKIGRRSDGHVHAND